tara:strand:+ start:69 stop:332 length:264 start_codon:yes stop_codon:yes gene_type:complete
LIIGLLNLGITFNAPVATLDQGFPKYFAQVPYDKIFTKYAQNREFSFRRTPSNNIRPFNNKKRKYEPKTIKDPVEMKINIPIEKYNL